jgi:hypothetical protein
MVKRRGPPSQGWRTFLRNHAPDIAAMDLFVVPTLGIDLLYAFVIIRLDRRDLVWTNVTTSPTVLNPANPNVDLQLRDVEEAAPRLGVEVVPFDANTESGITDAFAAMARRKADGVLVAADPVYNSRRLQLISLAVCRPHSQGRKAG